MNQAPQTAAEQAAWQAMVECLLKAHIANRHFAEVGSPTRDLKAFELASFSAAGRMIAEAAPEDRGYLVWAFWACLTTDSNPAKEAA